MKRILLIVAAVLLAAVLLAVFAIARGGDGTPSVRTETVERRNLVSTVSASGNIRARRQVDISSDISARVVELLVEEGDEVEEGQVLLRLERTQFAAALQRAQASLAQARAQLTQVRANRTRAQRTYARTRQLLYSTPPVVSQQEYEEAETALEVANANLDAAQFAVEQAQAGVAEAQDRLARTTISAPIAGKVTRLNVEQGETVIVGTMNNPGSLVLSISDLSIIEVVVEVDETEVPRLALGDSAAVDIDAFPDRAFAGRVTQIGNSAIRPPSGGASQPAIDFEVVITIDDPGVELRPDLSATAEIVTDRADDVVAVPIISLTIRDRADVDSTRFELPPPAAGEFQDVEGVFVVEDGGVAFRPVVVGITGREHFEVVSGLEPGMVVVSGPFQVIRQLADGDAVRVGGPEVPEA
ncbi:MAG TPA: efflux RND transporter periplasmic adaptor subunit [Longimicrobiales bacterium]|nr:efflux RND transporter periplasmic adaptor subunit [Longimicrobiales bacterium]